MELVCLSRRLGSNCGLRTKDWAALRKGRDLSVILGHSYEVGQAHVLLMPVRDTAEAIGYAGPHANVPGQVMREARSVGDRCGQVCACPYTHAGELKSAEPESHVSAP